MRTNKVSLGIAFYKVKVWFICMSTEHSLFMSYEKLVPELQVTKAIILIKLSTSDELTRLLLSLKASLADSPQAQFAMALVKKRIKNYYMYAIKMEFGGSYCMVVVCQQHKVCLSDWGSLLLFVVFIC